ncbi:Uncharacterised protein [Bordetella pertussis]|nr:Uncharacterised protein [Bordetella pertussis]
MRSLICASQSRRHWNTSAYTRSIRASLLEKYRYSKGWVTPICLASSRVLPSKPFFVKCSMAFSTICCSRSCGCSRRTCLLAVFRSAS